MYLDSIALTKTLPCLAEPGRIIVIGKPNRPLDEVIPYLATLPGIIAYNPETRTLTFRRPHGFMTLYPDKVYITQVVDAAEGLQLFEALKEAVNAVWEKREELVAVTAKKRAPRHLDIWELLPRSNCGACGILWNWPTPRQRSTKRCEELPGQTGAQLSHTSPGAQRRTRIPSGAHPGCASTRRRDDPAHLSWRHRFALSLCHRALF